MIGLLRLPKNCYIIKKLNLGYGEPDDEKTPLGRKKLT